MKTARAVAVTLCLWGSAAVGADWQFVDDWTDPINGFATKAATTTSPEGVALHLYRNPAGRVYALFTLPESAGGLPKDGVAATLTPEGFDSKVIEARTDQGRVIEYATTEGPHLRDRLWHGEGRAPAFGTLHDILEAPEVSANFALAGGAELNTAWSMTGAGTPIARALGITIEGASAGDEWDDAASQALLAAMTACQFPKLDVECVQKVTTCSSKISNDRDIEAFDTCVSD
ncbi:MAG: hypothetical protein AB3N22_05180 [Ruegeria sp.]